MGGCFAGNSNLRYTLEVIVDIDFKTGEFSGGIGGTITSFSFPWSW
jgi:hypothetical protein